MHIIGFSHHYTKLHGQTHGTLISVERFLIDYPYSALWFSAPWYTYDTEYQENGETLYYNLTPGHYLQLVFLGNNQIPFTTYRSIPELYTPFAPYDSPTYTPDRPYSDLIGEKFAFKFKGEPLPYQFRYQTEGVKIYS